MKSTKFRRFLGLRPDQKVVQKLPLGRNPSEISLSKRLFKKSKNKPSKNPQRSQIQRLEREFLLLKVPISRMSHESRMNRYSSRNQLRLTKERTSR
jgi:hypothetical protein